MQLLRAGVRLASLIPQQAHDEFDEALSKHGVPLTLSQIKPENLEELIDHLEDLSVDVDGKEGKSTRSASSANRAASDGFADGLLPRRSGFCIGTTCTVTSRTSDRNRFSTEPRSRMSKRDRADCPNTTWRDVLLLREPDQRIGDIAVSESNHLRAKVARHSHVLFQPLVRFRDRYGPLSSGGVTYTAYQFVARRPAMRAPMRSSRSVPGRVLRHTITFSGTGACSSP